jgi:hypothetical protein
VCRVDDDGLLGFVIDDEVGVVVALALPFIACQLLAPTWPDSPQQQHTHGNRLDMHCASDGWLEAIIRVEKRGRGKRGRLTVAVNALNLGWKRRRAAVKVHMGKWEMGNGVYKYTATLETNAGKWCTLGCSTNPDHDNRRR